MILIVSRNFRVLKLLLVSFLVLSCTKSDFPILGSLFDDDNNSTNPNSPEIVPQETLQKYILVDQFGYRPVDKKIAVIKNPQVGLDSTVHFIPGTHYEVINMKDGKSVFSGSPSIWNGGATQAQSGDKGWWFDFTSVETPGHYYLVDKDNNVRSPTFYIGENIYKDVFKAAVKVYYYQRSGVAKVTPYADSCWTDTATYTGAGQDGSAEDLRHHQAPGTYPSAIRDMSGGWYDAGDTNKYVTFAMMPIHLLLTAYEQHPSLFTDNYNIPESGNGLPDIIDEVKWEMDWLKKMQNSDGTVALKVGKVTDSNTAPPLSLDPDLKYYIASCTSSTVSAASMYAHASLVFSQFPALQTEALVLKTKAISAWTQFMVKYNAGTLEASCDDQTIQAGDADYSVNDQKAVGGVAAVYLFALTGDTAYETYLNTNYTFMTPFVDSWSRYDAFQGDALSYYLTLSNANSSLKTTFTTRRLNDVLYNNPTMYNIVDNDDLYRSHMPDDQLHWGSNTVRSLYGVSNMNVIKNNVVATNQSQFKERALGALHYIHGVNPFGWTYLTNMYKLGATSSVNKAHHYWFKAGSIWEDAKLSTCGPAPGYLTGGPNKNTNMCTVGGSQPWNNLICPAGEPLNLQPPQKAYRDSGVGWNAATQEQEYGYDTTEPSNVYQSAYIRLLANFVDP